MNFFSNKTNETQVGNPTEPNSGSEQDRYNAHFGVGDSGLDALKKFAQAKGVGAEQDRYGAHFGVEQEKVQAAAASILSAKGEGAEQDRHASHFGLGNDGWQKAKQLAAAKGTGAEQDRYGSHFSVDKDSVRRAAQSIQDKLDDAMPRK